MDAIQVPDAPAVPGLSFRHFRGEKDYPAMIAVITASAEADHVERVDTIEELANNYAHLSNCDPYQEMIFAEHDGRVIGYSRGWWWQETAGPRLYGTVGFLAPDFRRRGIGTAILRWIENRLRQVAAGHPAGGERFFQSFFTEHQEGLRIMLEKEGYLPVRHTFDMVRPDLENIRDFPLPEGLEVRPVLPEHYRAIWDADVEAFRDHWGYSEPTEEDYQAWLGSMAFQPGIWQIAWDKASNQIAGQVRTFINHAENEKFNRRRGYTEYISTRRPWRRQGLARALIAISLKAQKEAGMAESALGVDSENISGATRVYEDCGFRTVMRSTLVRKPL